MRIAVPRHLHIQALAPGRVRRILHQLQHRACRWRRTHACSTTMQVSLDPELRNKRQSRVHDASSACQKFDTQLPAQV
jgi:hypothetical protein